MNRIEKLKITSYLVPFIISHEEGKEVVELEQDTALWKEQSFEEVEINSATENVQLKIKENADKVKQFNDRQEIYALNRTKKDWIIRKIIQRNKE